MRDSLALFAQLHPRRTTRSPRGCGAEEAADELRKTIQQTVNEYEFVLGVVNRNPARTAEFCVSGSATLSVTDFDRSMHKILHPSIFSSTWDSIVEKIAAGTGDAQERYARKIKQTLLAKLPGHSQVVINEFDVEFTCGERRGVRKALIILDRFQSEVFVTYHAHGFQWSKEGSNNLLQNFLGLPRFLAAAVACNDKDTLKALFTQLPADSRTTLKAAIKPENTPQKSCEVELTPIVDLHPQRESFVYEPAIRVVLKVK